jgi:tetratricopeptide (TPR) repeat protein
MASLDLLQRPPGTLSVLLALGRPGPHTHTSLITDTGYSKSTLYAAVERLRDLMLVYERRVGRHTQYELSAEGRRAAGALAPLEEVVVSTIEGAERQLEVLRAANREDTPEGVDFHLRFAKIAIQRGSVDKGMESARVAATLAEAHGDSVSAGKAYLLLGKALRERSDKTADAILARAFDKSIRSGDPETASDALYERGCLREMVGDYARAESFYREASGVSAKTAHPRSRVNSLLGLGRVHVRRGAHGESIAAFREAVAILEGMGEAGEADLARAYGCLGATVDHAGHESGLAWHGKALDVAERVGDIRVAAVALANTAGSLIMTDRLEEAERCLVKAREYFERVKEPRQIGSVYIHLGRIATKRRRWAAAESAFSTAARIYQNVGDRYNLADTLMQEGRMKESRGRLSAARTLFRRSAEMFEDLGSEGKAAAARRFLDKLNPGTTAQSRPGTRSVRHPPRMGLSRR